MAYGANTELSMRCESQVALAELVVVADSTLRAYVKPNRHSLFAHGFPSCYSYIVCKIGYMYVNLLFQSNTVR